MLFMKTWKLVSGILCMVFVIIVVFQSCAVSISNSLDHDTADLSASGGIVLAFLMLAGGIVSVATRYGGKGGNIATCIIFALAALIGYSNRGNYGDLMVWCVWCAICALIALIAIFTQRNTYDDV